MGRPPGTSRTLAGISHEPEIRANDAAPKHQGITNSKRRKPRESDLSKIPLHLREEAIGYRPSKERFLEVAGTNGRDGQYW